MADGLTWESALMRQSGPSRAPGLKERIRHYERQLIVEALREAGGNQRRAAAALGCLPTTLNEKMRRLGLRQCDGTASERESPENTDLSAEEGADYPLY